MSSGVTVSHLNVADARRMLVPIPPMNEQKRILKIAYAIERKLNVDNAQASVLKIQFDTLLSHLMTGKLRVNNSEVPT